MNITYYNAGDGPKYTPALALLLDGREVGITLPQPNDTGMGMWSEGANAHANERVVVKPPWAYSWLPLYPEIRTTKRAVASGTHMNNFAGGNIYAIPFATPVNF